MRISFFFVLVVVGLAMSCDKDDDLTEQEKYDKQLGIDTVLIDSYLAERGIVAQTDTTGAGLRYVIHEAGEGRSPKYNASVPGDCFKTDYLGKLLEGDVPFDSLKGFSTSLSAGIIRGWKIGFQYLQEGDSATLYIPSGLAYGTVGSGAKIPANSVIYFHVRLLRVSTPEFNPANGTYECYYDDLK
jgi:FKBP-type peptidyl-prolyl cis-trans isomerase FkpA